MRTYGDVARTGRLLLLAILLLLLTAAGSAQPGTTSVSFVAEVRDEKGAPLATIDLVVDGWIALLRKADTTPVVVKYTDGREYKVVPFAGFEVFRVTGAGGGDFAPVTDFAKDGKPLSITFRPPGQDIIPWFLVDKGMGTWLPYTDLLTRNPYGFQIRESPRGTPGAIVLEVAAWPSGDPFSGWGPRPTT